MPTPIKITVEQALDIRAKYTRRTSGGAGLTTLASRYGVTVQLINRVLKGTHPSSKGLPDISATRGSSFKDPSLSRKDLGKFNP